VRPELLALVQVVVVVVEAVMGAVARMCQGMPVLAAWVGLAWKDFGSRSQSH